MLQHEDHVDLRRRHHHAADGRMDLLERLKEHHPSVPVILLTLIEEAKPTSLRAEEMGAAACLFKPIDPVSLMSGVDRVLGAA